MATSELTFEHILYFFHENNGVVRNRDAVNAFKRYLTDPLTKDDARHKFRTYINTIAHTKKGENDEKFLVLKSKYANSLEPPPIPPSPQYDPRNSVGLPLSPNVSSDFSPQRASPRAPPPYRPPPPVSASPTRSMDNVSLCSSLDGTPLAPPRRRSTDKMNLDRPKSLEGQLNGPKNEEITPKRNSKVDQSEDKENLTVKEKTQRFNRMASCDDELSPKPPKSAEKKAKGVDDVDGALGSPLDQKKLVEWYVTASKGEYHELVKLANAEPRLAKRKDPFTTVLHWGAKHGNQDIIKEFVGKYKVDVNSRTNGGYTPLHIAAQFGHPDVFNLLIDTYKADDSIRDYSGKKAQFYWKSKQQNRSNEVILRQKSRKKQTDKDLGFLRIGSLNVRVKKTTEAFSNFLGVGTGTITPMETMNEKVHKGWGSADNVAKDNIMGAPKPYNSKKKAKRPNEGINSTPTTPKTPTKSMRHFANDSDSDTAAGFDSNWKN